MTPDTQGNHEICTLHIYYLSSAPIPVPLHTDNTQPNDLPILLDLNDHQHTDLITADVPGGNSDIFSCQQTRDMVF